MVLDRVRTRQVQGVCNYLGSLGSQREFICCFCFTTHSTHPFEPVGLLANYWEVREMRSLGSLRRSRKQLCFHSGKTRCSHRIQRIRKEKRQLFKTPFFRTVPGTPNREFLFVSRLSWKLQVTKTTTNSRFQNTRYSQHVVPTGTTR